MRSPCHAFGDFLLDDDYHVLQGGPLWPLDAISIESNGISNQSNRNSQNLRPKNREDGSDFEDSDGIDRLDIIYLFKKIRTNK